MADRVGKPAAAGSVAPLDQLPAGELARKLAESQQMIARFSRENERLANQNEQLTGSKQIVANDYKGEGFCWEPFCVEISPALVDRCSQMPGLTVSTSCTSNKPHSLRLQYVQLVRKQERAAEWTG